MGYQEDRLRRMDIFEDTIQYCERNQSLVEAILQTRRNTVLYKNPLEECGGTNRNKYRQSCRISISQSRTLEAARRMYRKYPDSRIGILSAASATNPGGWVIRGWEGQEESLCRCSTLYPCLNTKELLQEYYARNKDRKNGMYTDPCVFTPGIVSIKTDTIWPEQMKESEWFLVDVISAAFPNQRENAWNTGNQLTMEESAADKEMPERLRDRITGMLQVVLDNDIDILVLGMCECGISGYCADVVVQVLKAALKEFRHSFKAVDFAIGDECFLSVLQEAFE